MSFPKYPAYKDSGVEWLGEVPEHWAVHSLKRAIERIESGTSVNAADFPAEQGSVGVLKTSCVYTGSFDWTENKTVDDEDLSRVSCPVRKNTLIVSRMNTPDLVGATGLVTEAPEGIFLPDRLWQIYFSTSHSPEFIFYFTKSREYREQVKMACSGTSASMQNLGQDDFRSLLFAEPPTNEQIQLARLLDHETARIDALIEEQQRLIELLKEKRQAVISHAVTKGLDPTVPMKDSGVEWLGEVPAHWELTRVGWQCIVGNGCTPARDNQTYWEDGHYPWLNSSKVNLERVVEADQFVTSLALRECALPIVKPGSVLMAITGEGKTRGLVTVTEIEATINQHVAFIEPRGNELFPTFLHDWLSANYSRLRHDSADWGSTKAAITCADIRAYPLPLPPIDEQEAICRFIGSKSSLIDGLVASANENVELLQERRSALISAAVTGKIDVRDWQPPGSTQTPKLAVAEAV